MKPFIAGKPACWGASTKRSCRTIVVSTLAVCNGDSEPRRPEKPDPWKAGNTPSITYDAKRKVVPLQTDLNVERPDKLVNLKLTFVSHRIQGNQHQVEAWGFGGFMPALLAGKVYDKTGSFNFVCYCSAVLLAIVAAAVSFLKPPYSHSK